MFMSWTDDLTGSAAKTSLTVTDTDKTVGAAFLPAYTVTVTADKAAVVEYTYNGGATKSTLTFGAAGGSQNVIVPEGHTLQLKVLASPAGHSVEWVDVSTKTAGLDYAREVSGSYSVGLNLTPLGAGDPPKGSVDNNMLLLLLAAIALAAASSLMFLLLRKRAVVTGIVRHNGKGVEGVKIEYTKKGGSSPAKTVTTDAEGRYKVKTSMNAEIKITATGASGEEMIIKKKVTEKDFDI